MVVHQLEALQHQGHHNLIRGIAVNIYLWEGVEGGFPETMLILETPSKNWKRNHNN